MSEFKNREGESTQEGAITKMIDLEDDKLNVKMYGTANILLKPEFWSEGGYNTAKLE